MIEIIIGFVCSFICVGLTIILNIINKRNCSKLENVYNIIDRKIKACEGEMTNLNYVHDTDCMSTSEYTIAYDRVASDHRLLVEIKYELG